MRPVFVALLVLCALSAGPRASAEEPADSSVRLLYSPKNLRATDLDATLEKHFEGDSAMKFTVDKQTNLLSIRANSKSALDDVLQTLSTIDRLPRSIVFQAFLIELAKPAEGAAPVELDPAQLTAAPDVALRVATRWVRDGKVARIRTFKWTGLENQVADEISGEIAPKAQGMSMSVRGQPTAIFMNSSLGITFSIKPRISESNDVVCEFLHTGSQLEAKTEFVKPDGSYDPQAMRQSRLQTAFTIPSGRCVVVSTHEGQMHPQPPGEFIVLSATVIDPQASPSAATASAAYSPFVIGGTSLASRGPTSLLLIYRYRSVDLHLTDEQKKKLDELEEEQKKVSSDFFQKRRERGGDTGDATYRDEMNAVSVKRAEIDAKALALLTADQKKAFEAYLEDQRNSVSGDRSTFLAPGFGRPGRTP